MLQRLAAWHGCSGASSGQGGVRQVLVGEHCGLEAAPGTRLAFEAQAALFGLAATWRLQPHLFTRPRQRFEPEDADRCVGWGGWLGSPARAAFGIAAASSPSDPPPALHPHTHHPPPTPIAPPQV